MREAAHKGTLHNGLLLVWVSRPGIMFAIGISVVGSCVVIVVVFTSIKDKCL